MPESEQHELVAQMKLTKHAPNTITSKKAPREELDGIQTTGFAVDDQELVAALYAIAASVRNEAREVVAAVNLTVPSALISLEGLGPHLVSIVAHLRATRPQTRRRDGQGRVGAPCPHSER